jgi:hypothetical protein
MQNDLVDMRGEEKKEKENGRWEKQRVYKDRRPIQIEDRDVACKSDVW